MMRLVNKLLVVRIGLIATIVFGLTFTGLFVWGISTLVDAEYWARHTNSILALLSNTQKSIVLAEQQGRAAITNRQALIDLPVLRATAFANVQRFRAATQDNPHQMENADAMEAALKDRYKTQDEQIASVIVNDQTLTFNAATTAEAISSAKAVENALMTARTEELSLLQDRDGKRSVLQFRLSSGMLAAFILSIAAVIWSFYFLLRELKNSEAVIGNLQRKIRLSTDASTVLTEAEINDLIHVIDEGEQNKLHFSAALLIF